MTAAPNTQTTPDYYEPEAVSNDPEQHKLRVLIDEVATLRGLTIQMAMRMMGLAAAPDNSDRAMVLDEFRTLHAQFTANLGMLFGKEPPEAQNREHVEWIRRIAEANRDRQASLTRVETEVQAVADVLELGHVPTFTEARQFFDKFWPVVRDGMTEIIWDLWADLDAQKNEAIENNAALQDTLQNTISDIQQISTAIRMIAINTAVLAARPQEGAEGFQVIAREVKALAENIDDSSTKAKATISGLL